MARMTVTVCDNCGNVVGAEKFNVKVVHDGKVIQHGEICEECYQGVPLIMKLPDTRRYVRQS